MYLIRVQQTMYTEKSLEEGVAVEKELTFTAPMEKLQQLIGRYVLRYGIPHLINDKDGWKIIEFFLEKDDKIFSCDVLFKEVVLKKQTTSQPEIVDNEKVTSFIEAGVLIRR